MLSLWRLGLPALFLCLTAATLSAQTAGDFLGHLTWPEAETRIRESPIVVIPFGGGAKEHGPHLPMNADAVVLEYLLQQAVDSTDVVVAPAILHGWFPAFRSFPGTEIADPEVFRSYVYEVGRSLAEQGARRLVFLNTGITMATGLPISMVARDLRVEYGIPVLVLSWNDLETDEVDALAEQRAGGHADELETSIHLFLQPDLVHMDRAVTDYGDPRARDYPGYEPGLFSRDPSDPRYSTTGLFGDPTLATREKGEAVLAILTRQWLKALRGFAEVPLGGGR